MEQRVSTVDDIERVLFIGARGDVSDFKTDFVPHLQLTSCLIFQSQRDHIGGEVDSSDFNTIISGHVKGRTSGAAADIEDLLTGLKVEFLTKCLHPATIFGTSTAYCLQFGLPRWFLLPQCSQTSYQKYVRNVEYLCECTDSHRETIASCHRPVLNEPFFATRNTADWDFL